MGELNRVGRWGGVRRAVGVGDGLGVPVGAGVAVGDGLALGKERVAASSASANTRVLSVSGVGGTGVPAQLTSPITIISMPNNANDLCQVRAEWVSG